MLGFSPNLGQFTPKICDKLHRSDTVEYSRLKHRAPTNRAMWGWWQRLVLYLSPTMFESNPAQLGCWPHLRTWQYHLRMITQSEATRTRKPARLDIKGPHHIDDD